MNSQIYKVNTINSKTITEKIDSRLEEYICKKIKKGLIVCWFHQSVFVGKIEDSKIIFHEKIEDFEKYLIECRAFNEKEELKIWSKNNIFYSRHRIDQEGEPCEIVDTELIMLGTRSDNFKDNFNIVTEERGVNYYVPSELFGGKKLNDKTRLVLSVRNYIGYNEIGQAGYIDNRFIKIEVKEA